MQDTFKVRLIWGLIFLSIGILELLISIVGMCKTEGYWDADFILAFLRFKKASPKMGIGGLYYLRAMGYSFVLVGVAVLIFGSRRVDRSDRTK
jgi:hypothetical protein